MLRERSIVTKSRVVRERHGSSRSEPVQLRSACENSTVWRPSGILGFRADSSLDAPSKLSAAAICLLHLFSMSMSGVFEADETLITAGREFGVEMWRASAQAAPALLGLHRFIVLEHITREVFWATLPATMFARIIQRQARRSMQVASSVLVSLSVCAATSHIDP